MISTKAYNSVSSIRENILPRIFLHRLFIWNRENFASAKISVYTVFKLLIHCMMNDEYYIRTIYPPYKNDWISLLFGPRAHCLSHFYPTCILQRFPEIISFGTFVLKSFQIDIQASSSNLRPRIFIKFNIRV